MEFVIKTFGGLEEVLAEELKSLGMKEIEVGRRAVMCSGTEEDVFKLNYLLRTALKVLISIDEFEITGKEDLYSNAFKIQWEQFISQHDSFCIDSVMYSELFDHSNYPSLVVKDAVVDYFKEKFYKRPNVNKDQPNARFNLHIQGNKVSISLDTSGDALFRRGYRDYTNEAPLNEVMAAGLIMLSGWDKSSDFLDPMCGSGTILLEAAMMASNIPAGYKREHFAFMDWPKFKERAWTDFKARYKWEVNKGVKIYGQDLSVRTVKTIAQANVKNLGFADIISISKQDFFKSEEQNQSYHICTNPPYDERIELDDDLKFYEDLGTVLKFKYKGSKATIISSNEEAMKRIGMKPSFKTELNNVNLNYKIYSYEIF